MSNHWENLELAAQQVGMEIDEKKKEQLKEYLHLLQSWNKVMNLTAIDDEPGIIYKHFLDCIYYLSYARIKPGQKIVDLGTGAGFPGIPLKILYPQTEVYLVDSLQKRLKFLQEVIEKLQLKEISLIHGRAEDLGKDPHYREKFDVVLSRAVASLPVLTEYCLPFVKVGGHLAAAKGPQIQEELAQAQKAISVLGGKLEEVYEFQLPYIQEGRSVIIISKLQATPKNYPRRAGIPAKRPLI